MATLEQQGYQLLTTDEIRKALAAGKRVTLPPACIDDEGLREVYTGEELSHLNLVGDMNDIFSVEYVGDEPVQCIAIDDPDHVYLTDGFIPTHNTSNIVFLKSTDDSMIDTLQKMSGTRHRAYTDSKAITRDMEAIWLQNEGKATYTMSVREEPVISFNDMSFIGERQSIVFRAGNSPIWNRDMTILPMSWRLFKDTIVQPGKEYSLQTIPSTSTAADFDVRKNMPDFGAMLDKRIAQALEAEQAKVDYADAYGYKPVDIARLDPDVYANEIMDIINDKLHPEEAISEGPEDMSEAEMMEYLMDEMEPVDRLSENSEPNDEVLDMMAHWEEQQRLDKIPCYAGKTLSKFDLVSPMGINHSLDRDILEAYRKCRNKMAADSEYFVMRGQELCGVRGEVYIQASSNEDFAAKLDSAAKDPSSRVYAEESIEDNVQHRYGFVPTDAFYRFLASLDAWTFAQGSFEDEMARIARNK